MPESTPVLVAVSQTHRRQIYQYVKHIAVRKARARSDPCPRYLAFLVILELWQQRAPPAGTWPPVVLVR